jgi:hypothetical protein
MKITNRSDLLKWEETEKIWYIDEEDWVPLIVNLLIEIFEETLYPGKTEFFNIYALIRQNYLSICETPEIVEEIFGQKYVFVRENWQGDIGYLFLSKFETKVVDSVIQEMGLRDKKL